MNRISYSLPSAAIVYIIVAFSTYEVDPSKWGEVIRSLAAFAWCGVWMLSVLWKGICDEQ